MHGSHAGGLPVKKKASREIDANTERIFKLQQQNMKLREEIRNLQKGE